MEFAHANARFAPVGRVLMVQRIGAGMAQARVACQVGLSRGTVAKWWHGWCEEGEAGLVHPVLAAASVASAHRGEARGADLSAETHHKARAGVSVGASGGAGLDDLAHP